MAPKENSTTSGSAGQQQGSPPQSPPSSPSAPSAPAPPPAPAPAPAPAPQRGILTPGLPLLHYSWHTGQYAAYGTPPPPAVAQGYRHQYYGANMAAYHVAQGLGIPGFTPAASTSSANGPPPPYPGRPEDQVVQKGSGQK